MINPVIRLTDPKPILGIGTTALYERIKDGTFPPGFKLGGAKAVGWFQSEVQEIINANAAGKSEAELREIVRRQLAARKALAN